MCKDDVRFSHALLLRPCCGPKDPLISSRGPKKSQISRIFGQDAQTIMRKFRIFFKIIKFQKKSNIKNYIINQMFKIQIFIVYHRITLT